MRIPIHSGASAALLLAAMASAGLWIIASMPPRPLPAPAPAARVALERCLEQVATVHDVYWAAACMQTADDWPDCTLPTEKARPLNAARAADDQRCMAEAAQLH